MAFSIKSQSFFLCNIPLFEFFNFFVPSGGPVMLEPPVREKESFL